MKKLFILTILISALFIAKAQTVRNVNFTVQGNDIQITYDLLDNGKGENCYIEVFYSSDNGINWKGPINKNISGDIGKNISAGTNKKIVWKPLLSLSWLYSDYVMFKVAITDGLNLEMVFVEGGTFTMGCISEQGSDCYDNEKPTHSVTVSDFYIGKYEVTQSQWMEIMGSNPSNFSGCSNCPVEKASWNDIQDFLNKLNKKNGRNYRLPTEAEWEYAARGGSKGSPSLYAGSDNIDAVAWYADNSGSKTHPVGQKSPNELGIYDMSGNVWEWCNNWYGSYSSGSQTNPVGAASGSGRVLRGGGWDYNARYCRVSGRTGGDPVCRFTDGGFRLVLSSE